MSQEWTGWIEHDGGPRPVPAGTYCHVVYRSGHEFLGPVGIKNHGFEVTPPGKPWGWPDLIIRYRIRKPRALIELRDMIADLPAPTERVDA